MAQRSLASDVREIHTFEESSSFGTGASGDVPPPVPGSAVPRPRSTTTRGRHERRSSAAAPLPWRDGRPSASEEEDCRMVDGVRRALRFLFEAEQYQLEQALREELSNTQVGYLMHCFSLWEDSDEASSAATSLDIPDRRCRASHGPCPQTAQGAHTQPPPVEVMPISRRACLKQLRPCSAFSSPWERLGRCPGRKGRSRA